MGDDANNENFVVRRKRKVHNIVIYEFGREQNGEEESFDSNVDASATESQVLETQNELENGEIDNENIENEEGENESIKEGIAMDGIQNWRIRSTEGSYPSPPPSDKEIELNEELKEEETSSVPCFQESFNEKALSRFAATYELEKYKKHALIIFNQEDIDDAPRLGTNEDVEALTNTFEKFGFEVKENVHNDLIKEEIFKKLDEFMKRDYTDYGCVGVAILTHGSRYGRLRAKDKQYSEMDIIDHLKVYNKPSLVTKPKFLIIQACRGTKIKPPVPVREAARIRTDTDADLDPYHLPEEADMLILHSCYMGSPSLRHEANGSWFIQTLCQKIDQFAATHDLESIITEVKRAVAIDRYKLEYKTLPVKICQMPVLTSTLIRKLYLKRFGDPPALDTGLVRPISGPVEPLATRKDSQMLEPGTPLLSQLSCYCFLEHFIYMRTCLKYYVEDNPDDETGRLHLDLANEFDEKVEHNNAKQKMLRIIHDHLKNKAKDFEYYKYLYLYNK